MKSLTIFLLFFFSFGNQPFNAQSCWHSPGKKDLRFAFNPGYNYSKKHIKLQLDQISYFQFQLLPKISTFTHPNGIRVKSITSTFLLRESSNNEKATLFINDYQWLRLNRNMDLICEYSLISNSRFMGYTNRNPLISLTPTLFNEQESEFLPPVIFNMPTEDLVESTKYCKAKIRTIETDKDCINMAGTMSIYDCTTIITYELTEQDDILKYGRIQLLRTTEGELCKFPNMNKICITKYKDGSIYVKY